MKAELTSLYNQNPAEFAKLAAELLNKPMPMRVYKHVETGRHIAASPLREYTFTGPMPNPEHIVGVTYDPMNWIAWVSLTDGIEVSAHIGDYLSFTDAGEVEIWGKNEFESQWELKKF